MAKGYDIVGDIHGRFDAFMELITDLGYVAQADGSLRHFDADRQLILVGDIINKGLQNKAMLDTARVSVDAGTMQVVMGNHEFFNVCYARKGEDGHFLLNHSEKADQFLKTFLDEFPLGTQANVEAIDWMAARPIYVSTSDLTVMHAMHTPRDLSVVASELDDNHVFTAQAFERHAGVAKSRGYGEEYNDGRFFWAVERLLYGMSIRAPGDLPDQGYTKRLRLNWWEGEGANPVRLLGLEDARLDEELIRDISEQLRRVETIQGHALKMPEGLVAFGHYSLPGEPGITSDKALCLDFKGVDGRGVLTAYRFNEGDTEFHDDRITCVEAPFPDADGPGI